MSDHIYPCGVIQCRKCLEEAGGGLLIDGDDYQLDGHKGLINIRSWRTITDKERGLPEDETLFNIFYSRNLDAVIQALTWFRDNLKEKWK